MNYLSNRLLILAEKIDHLSILKRSLNDFHEFVVETRKEMAEGRMTEEGLTSHANRLREMANDLAGIFERK